MKIDALRRALPGHPFTRLDVVALTPAYRHTTGALAEAAVLVPIFSRAASPTSS